MREKSKNNIFIDIRNRINFFNFNKKRDENIVYFVSFPKSGRSWLQLMLAKIYSELTGIDFELFLDENKDLVWNQIQSYPFLKVSHGYKNSRIAQGDVFPVNYYKNAKVILMVRDPRDVVVSHYYHEKYHYKCFDGSISDFIRYEYDENQPDPGRRKARIGIMPIVNYMNAWQKNSSILDSYHLFTYEDMKKEPFENLDEICKFIGLPVNEEFLLEVIDACSFKKMRKLEEKNEIKWHGLGKSDTKKGFKTRKGKAGGYVDELSEEDISYLDIIIRTNLDPFYSRYI